MPNALSSSTCPWGFWGVGHVRQAQLAGAGIHTVGQLAAVHPDVLDNLLGKGTGGKLSALASNSTPPRRRGAAGVVDRRPGRSRPAAGHDRAAPLHPRLSGGPRGRPVAGGGPGGADSDRPGPFTGMRSVTRGL